jgi:colanic acid biosynthesis protein WcaH
MIIDDHLYQQIVQVMPIPCVDLVVTNDSGQVLLARRENEPARGEWWFPGGRVHYLETRVDAAVRKLRQECALEANQLVDLGTFDVIVKRSDNGKNLHGITTLYCMKVNQNQTFTLDSQNSEAQWRLPLEWLKLELHSFVQHGLTVFSEDKKLLRIPI